MIQERMRHALDKNTEIIFYDDGSAQIVESHRDIPDTFITLSEDATDRLEKVLKWR